MDNNTPSIRIKEEAGLLILSLLLKSLNPAWGNNLSPLSKMVNDYFQFIPSRPEFIEVVKQFQQAGLSEQTLFNLALTFHRPEREAVILNHLSSETGLTLEQLSFFQKNLVTHLETFKQMIDASPLKQMFINFNTKDTVLRMAELEELKQELGKLQKFFRLSSDQTDFIFTPSDPLFSEYIGLSLFLTPHQTVFMTHNPTVKTQIYQIMRYMLEPTVDKIIASLSEAQRQSIAQNVSGKIRQFYGYDTKAILMAELLTIYYNNVFLGQPLEDFEAYQERVEKLSGKDFLQALETNTALRDRCRYFNVHNLTEFKTVLRQYYDLFYKDNFSFVLLKAYQIYQNQHPNINFEQFALVNLPKMV